MVSCFYYCLISYIEEAIRDPKEYTVLCNDKNPVWVCEHTMDNSHLCKYLLCKDCFYEKLTEEATNGKTKRVRSVVEERENENAKDYDDNDIKKQTKCDHSCNGLQVFNCSSYFTEQYIRKKMGEEDCYYPTKCSGCRKAVRNKYEWEKMVSV